MVRAHLSLLFLLTGLLVSCDETAMTPAEAAAVPRPVSEAEFVAALSAASRSGKPDAVKTLVHPAILRQFEKRNRAFFLDWLSREAHRAIPETCRATTTAIPREAPLPFARSFVYPIRPTLSLRIDFEDSAGGSLSMVRRVIVDEDGVWWLVVPVPTAETLERMQRTQRSRADRERIERVASDLARTVEEPLLSELKALLQEGRKITAIKRYREASGEGLRAAKSVIDALEEEMRSVPQEEERSR